MSSFGYLADAAASTAKAEINAVHARWSLAERVIDAVSDVGGVVAGEYVRNYVAYKAAQEGQACVWKGKRLTEIDVPKVVTIWVCRDDLGDIQRAIKDLNVGLSDNADEYGHFTVTLIDVDACRLVLQNMLPDFVDYEKIVEGCNFLPDNGENPEILLDFILFDSYPEMRTFEGRAEEINWECNSLCIYERVIQPTFGQLSPYENMQAVTRICGDILAGRTKWIGTASARREELSNVDGWIEEKEEAVECPSCKKEAHPGDTCAEKYKKEVAEEKAFFEDYYNKDNRVN